MMSWLRKYNKQVLLITFGGFVLGGVVFSGLQGFSSVSPFSPVLVVNGENIPYQRFSARLQQNLSRHGPGTQASPENVESVRASTLQELVQETAFLQEADRYGIVATDNEVAAYIQSVPAFQREGRFHQGVYLQSLAQALRTTPAAFEEERRRDIRRQKLMMVLGGSVKVTPDEARQAFRFRAPSLTDKERKELSAHPEKLRAAVSQEQGNAVFQAWIQQINGRLKVDNRLDRWERQNS